MNFTAIDRRGTYTSKLDDAINRFGTTDLLPLWVADMDLESPVSNLFSLPTFHIKFF
jgi:cystathionine beta-lyase